MYFAPGVLNLTPLGDTSVATHSKDESNGIRINNTRVNAKSYSLWKANLDLYVLD